jgi:hypothetical protein
MLKIIALGLLAMLATGCSSLHTSQSNAPLNATVNANLKANIDVGEPITGKSAVTTVFGIFSFGDNKYSDGVNYGVSSGGFSSMFGGSVEEAKSAAAYNAVSTSKADLILLPRYTIEETSYFFFKTTTVSVVGNKGTLRSIVEAK